jgi:5-methylcytosine-specific restriction enzyme subunit McrC
MSIITSGWQREQSLRSGNIYQIYAYLRSQEDTGDPLSSNATGVLLYPSLGVDYDEEATIQGHRIRFATVDLTADTRTIRCQLLRIVEA